MKRKAFTLIELMVVVAIVGILVAMILPAVTAAKKRAAENTTTASTTKNAAGRSVLVKPSQFVTDTTGSIPPQLAAALNEKLAQLERDTTAQMLVYMVPVLPEGEELEAFCNNTFNAWGVGRADKKNGLVLFIFKDSRKLRVETGYGLEGRIPDVVSKRITSEKVTPRFKVGDYTGGVVAAVDELDRLVRAEAASAKWAGKEAVAAAVPLTKSQLPPNQKAGAGSGSSSPSSSSALTDTSSSSPSPARSSAPAAVPPAAAAAPPAGRAVAAAPVAAAPQESGNSGFVLGLFMCMALGLVAMGFAWNGARSKTRAMFRELNSSREECGRLRSRVSRETAATATFEGRAVAAELRLAQVANLVWLSIPNASGWWWYKPAPGIRPEARLVDISSLGLASGYWARMIEPANEPEPPVQKARRKPASPASPARPVSPASPASFGRAERVAGAGLVAATAAVAAAAAVEARRRKERDEADRRKRDDDARRRRERDDDDQRSRSSYASSDSGSSSSSSSSSFDSGGGSSGGGGSSDSW